MRKKMTLGRRIMSAEITATQRMLRERPNVAQIYIALAEIEPPVWRRLVVPLDTTLAYDYGDNWRHTVTLEKLFVVKPAPKAATCIEGARCCPPEDVGGPHGYFEFLRVLLSPEPDEIGEQRHLKRWSGGKFDPERFDVEKTSKTVRTALRNRRLT